MKTLGMNTLGRTLILASSLALMSAVAPNAAAAPARGPTCSVVVPSGGSIQDGLDAYPGGVVCLATNGSYAPTQTLRPANGTTLRTAPGGPVATINCPSGPEGNLIRCFDASGTTGVWLARVKLVFAPASGSNYPGSEGVHTGYDTKVGPAVSISGAGEFGINANGDAGQGAVINKVTVTGSGMGCDDGWYASNLVCAGIHATEGDGLTVENSTAANNPSDGIWFDNDTLDGWTVKNNTVTGNAGQGIRIEISCHGTVSDNTVTGNADAAIALENANNVAVDGNTVAAATGAGDGAIRMIASGRTTASGGGDGNCAAADGNYYNEANTAGGNSIALVAGAPVGFWTTAPPGPTLWTYDDSFSGDVYTGGQCGANDWHYADSSDQNQPSSFTAWQSDGEDRPPAGSCS